MKRRFYHILAIASLVLSIALGALWFRSYWVCDGFARATPQTLSFGRNFRGCLSVVTADREMRVVGWEHIIWKHKFDYKWNPTAFPSGGWAHSPGREWSVLGFWNQTGKQSILYRGAKGELVDREETYHAWGFPYWPACLLFAWPAYVLIFKWVRRIRRPWPAGHCQRCGYDLRESLERCPECGTLSKPSLFESPPRKVSL